MLRAEGRISERRAGGLAEMRRSSCRLPGQRLVRVLERLQAAGRRPQQIVVDNGTELTSKVVDQWAYQNGVQRPHSALGYRTPEEFARSAAESGAGGQ